MSASDGIRDRVDELRRRAAELVDVAYSHEAGEVAYAVSWRLRDVAAPLVLDCLAELEQAVDGLERAEQELRDEVIRHRVTDGVVAWLRGKLAGDW